MHFSLVQNPDIAVTPYRCSAVWEPEAVIDPLEAEHWPEFLRTASPKRQMEFAAGRWCAGQAIRSLNPTTSRQVGVRPDRTPQWPEGLVGSITHTAGFASAAVAPQKECLSLGIDSERVQGAEMSSGVAEVVFSSEERRLARGFLSSAQFNGLIFSAKESVYKCLYPLVGRPFEFSAVVLTEIDLLTSTFSFRLAEKLSAAFTTSFRAQGRFEFSGGCVHTGVDLRRP